jgi:hypothetical protein
MPEKIDFAEIHSTFLGWFIIRLMNRETEKRNIPNYDFSQVWPDINSKEINVSCTIDGVEVPIVEVLTEYFEQNGAVHDNTLKDLFDAELVPFRTKVQELDHILNLFRDFGKHILKEELEKRGLTYDYDTDQQPNL